MSDIRNRTTVPVPSPVCEEVIVALIEVQRAQEALLRAQRELLALATEDTD